MPGRQLPHLASVSNLIVVSESSRSLRTMSEGSGAVTMALVDLRRGTANK